jgi:LuxR family quorum sensing-dependent transcriptional regulator
MTNGTERNFAFDTIDHIGRLKSLPQVGAVFAGAMAKLGFTSLGVSGLPPPVQGADPVVLAERAPDGFRDFYIHECFYPVDHIATYARTAVEPFRFSDASYHPTQSRDCERYMQALRSYGIGEGLIVPLGRPNRVPVGVWLAGESPDLHDSAIQIIHLIALFAASKARALARRRREGKPPLLTVRECEVLTWAAQGKTAWEIGMILRIAKRTVDEHTRSAACKLGAANKTQAVVLALLKHLIEV